jgi:hypothetical protein
MRKYLIGALLLFSATSVIYAGCSGNYCSGVKVKTLLSIKNGIVYLDTTGVETSLNCTPISGKYIALGGNGKNMVYAMLLTAQTTNKDIVIETSPSGNCLLNWVRLAN